VHQHYPLHCAALPPPGARGNNALADECNQVFAALPDEIKAMRKAMWAHESFAEERRAAERELHLTDDGVEDGIAPAADEEELKMRKFTALILQRYESNITQAMCQFFDNDTPHKCNTFVFDGAMVQRIESLPMEALFDPDFAVPTVDPKLLRRAERFIHEKTYCSSSSWKNRSDQRRRHCHLQRGARRPPDEAIRAI
jgi:hypothetical protein